MFVVTFGLRNRIIPIIKIRRRSEYYVDKFLKMTEKLVGYADAFEWAYGSDYDDYERRWKELRGRYARVVIRTLEIGIFGEMFNRYFAMEDEKKCENTLYVIIPVYSQGYINSCPDFLKYIDACDKEETKFWLYVISHYKNEVDLSEWSRFTRRTNFKTYYTKAYSIEGKFCKEEICVGETKLHEMGINSRYGLLFARNGYYYTTMYGREPLANKLINLEFECFNDTIKLLKSKGYQCVRTGKHEKPLADNCYDIIDYGGLFWDGFMDLYLASKCEFAIMTANGSTSLPWLFAKPLLMIDVAILSYCAAGDRYTEYDIFLPRKFYSITDNRYLSYLECCEVDYRIFYNKTDPEELGVRLEHNSPEEIRDAAEELIKRIEVVWDDEEVDVQNEEVFRKQWETNYKKKVNEKNEAFIAYGSGIDWRPSATFMRNNPWWLGAPQTE